LLQRAKSATQSVPVVITTHDCNIDAMQNSVDKIAKLSTVVDKPCLLALEE
jgi:homoserine dehydrogenase